ncbi:MAG: N-acetylmuramoyl-L-alanine amidase [Acutalibacteraceae bacterium]
MKKTIYATIGLKQLIICFSAIIVAAATVFCLNIYQMRSSAQNEMKNETPLIIIDAGHGGEDGGTVSSSGIVEKDINLNISRKICEILNLYGFDTLMIRSDDKLIYDSDCKTVREKKVSDIHNRMNIVNQYPDSIFLSIHQNHFDQSKYCGAQVFYSKNNEASKEIAECIQSSIVSKLQPENTRLIKPSGSEIYLLYHAKSPAVMVECGFLSNGAEAQLLNDDEYQTKMAAAIIQGIFAYLETGSKI